MHEHQNDIPFLPGRMTIEKIGKLLANLHDKKEYDIHIRNLKQALNYGLALKKVQKSKSLTKIIHQYELRAKERYKDWL